MPPERRGETMSQGHIGCELAGSDTRCTDLKRGGGLGGDEPARP